MVLALSCRCLCPIHWNQVLSREWRCSWSRADRWILPNVLRNANLISILNIRYLSIMWNIARWPFLGLRLWYLINKSHGNSFQLSNDLYFNRGYNNSLSIHIYDLNTTFATEDCSKECITLKRHFAGKGSSVKFRFCQTDDDCSKTFKFTQSLWKLPYFESQCFDRNI